MRAHVQELIAGAAKSLANKVHTEEEMHVALYQLALDIRAPARLDDHPPTREERR